MGEVAAGGKRRSGKRGVCPLLVAVDGAVLTDESCWVLQSQALESKSGWFVRAVCRWFGRLTRDSGLDQHLWEIMLRLVSVEACQEQLRNTEYTLEVSGKTMRSGERTARCRRRAEQRTRQDVGVDWSPEVD